MAGEKQPVAIAPASRWFSRILVVLIGITVGTFLAWIIFGLSVPHPSSSQSSTLEQVERAFFAGFGSLVGLIGGKFS